MSDSLAVSLHSGSEIASGSGAAVDTYGDDGCTLRAFLRLQMVVSAIDGALTVAVETSPDGATWEQIGAFSVGVDAEGFENLVVGDCERYIRATWALAGTSATFSVSGTAEVTYCRLDDLGHENILPSTLTSGTKIKYLLATTEEVRGRLMSRATGPIVAIGGAIRRAVAKLTVLNLMVEEIGINPQSDAHVALFTQAGKAESYIKDVSAGRAAADFTDSTPNTYEGTGIANTGSSAGWGGIGVR